MLRAILFDIGNVILPFDFTPAMIALRARSRIQENAAWEKAESLKYAYEGGGLSRGDFIAAMRKEVGFEGTDADFEAIWSDIFTCNPGMEEFVRAQHATGLPLYLLSNTSDLHVEYFTARFPIFECFRGAVYSHVEKLLKPDPAIFQVAIERFALEPAQTLYIDDLAPNIETAHALGFVTIQYDFRNHLESLGPYGSS